MKKPVFLLLALLLLPASSLAAGKVVQTPYEEQSVVFDFFFDEPSKINSALFWVRSFMNPLVEEPYNQAPEFLNIVIVIHGTEIVSTVSKNYEKYKDAVERMKYYESLGVKFKVCGIAASDYHYSNDDFYDFIEIVPSAMNELVHWQQQGYGLITPQVHSKKFSIDEIR